MRGTRNAEVGTRNRSAEPGTRNACSAFRVPRSTFGFTLMEMVVVLAIVGITAAAVVPAMTRITSESGALSAARQLEQVLAAARTTALERAIATEVVVAPQLARYWVHAADSGTIDFGLIELEQGVTLSSTAIRPHFRFAPSGTATADSLVALGPDAAVLLTVDPWSGAIRASQP